MVFIRQLWALNYVITPLLPYPSDHIMILKYKNCSFDFSVNIDQPVNAFPAAEKFYFGGVINSLLITRLSKLVAYQ